jgi:transposase
MRDLNRARDDTLSDLTEAQLRRTAFLRRHDSRYPGRTNWSPAPLRWLSAVGGPTPAHHIVFHAYGCAVTAPPARLRRRAHARHEHVPSWRFHAVVAALQALRGGQCTVAVTMVADIGALNRCDPQEHGGSLWAGSLQRTPLVHGARRGR